MTKLGNLRFSNGGTLSYDSINAVCSIKPTRVFDFTVMSDNIVKWQSGTEVLDNGYDFREIGPFNSEDEERNYLLSLLEDHEPRGTKFGKGIYRLLQLFVEWFPREESANPFVILHPDLDLQNLLVDDNGAVVSLIDWDGAATVSRSVGCAYPKWLTHDWDPWNYVYHSGQPDRWGRIVQSPQELKRYREMYTNFLQQASLENTGTISTAQNADTVRKSLLMGSLKLAMENSQSTDDIVLKIYDLIAQITSQKTFRAESDSKLQLENAYDVSSRETDGVKSETSTSEQSNSSSATSSDTAYSIEKSHSRYIWESTPPIEILSRSSIDSNNLHSNPAVDEVGRPTNAVKDLPLREHTTNLALASIPSRQSSSLKKKAEALQMRSRLRTFSKVWSSMSRFGDTKYEHNVTAGLSVIVDSTIFEIVNTRDLALIGPAKDNVSHERARGAAVHRMCSYDSSPDKDLGESSSTPSLEKIESSSENSTLDNPGSLAPDHTAYPEVPQCQTIDNTDNKQPSASDHEEQIEHTSKIKEEQITSSSTTPSQNVKTDLAEESHHKAAKAGRRRRLLKKKKESPHTTTTTGSHTTSDTSPTSKSRTKRIISWFKTVGRNHHLKDDTQSASTSPVPDRHSSDSGSKTATPEAQNSTGTPPSSLAHDPEVDRDRQHTTSQSVSNQEIANQCGTSSATEAIPCPPSRQKFDLDKLEFIDDDRLYDQRFLPPQVCEDLVDGTLDEARMRRLKTGFEVLLNSL